MSPTLIGRLVSGLTPHAARIALQILLSGNFDRVPAHWLETYTLALYARAAPAADLTEHDLLVVASAASPSVGWIAAKPETNDQINARLLIIDLRTLAEMARLASLRTQ